MIASEHRQRCRPVHLLAALSELDGPIGAVLTPPSGQALLPRPADAPKVNGGGASYICHQTQRAARMMAAGLDEPVSPAHLLVAIIDQADSEAMTLLEEAGIHAADVRTTALAVAGLPPGLPTIVIPPLAAAGYMDRPILAEADLDPAAWELLTWRQSHLPLYALRRPRDWDRLRSLEAHAAERVYRRLHLHQDQELSLRNHHLERVQQLAHQVRPALVPTPPPRRRPGLTVSIALTRRRRWPPRLLWFTRSWGSWFGNRWSGMNRRSDQFQTFIFAFRTRDSYRNAPTPLLSRNLPPKP